MKTIFCVDSCSLMESWNDRYPIENFEGLWRSLENGFRSGAIVSSDMIYEELADGDDDLSKWAKNLRKFFVTSDSKILVEVGRLVNTYKFVDPNAVKDKADPYLIALSKINKFTVVTQENLVGAGAKLLKIPNVCQAEGVQCIKMVEMIKQLNWNFK